jgi:hypothetical protein
VLQAAPRLHPIFLGIACANPYAALTCPAYAGAAQIAVGGSNRDALRAFNLGLGSAAAGGSSLGAQVAGYINAENDLPDNDNGNTKTRSTARVIQVSDTGGSLSNGAAAGAFVNLFRPTAGSAMMGIYDVPDAPVHERSELEFLVEDIVRQAGEPVLVALFLAVDLTLFTPGVPDVTLLVLASWQSTRIARGSLVRANRAIGLKAERFLRNTFGGKPASFLTSQGRRFVDNLVRGVAQESKVGRTALTRRVRQQVRKDAELLSTRRVDAVEWHFSRGTSGIGPTQPLREVLENTGIRIIIHP